MILKLVAKVVKGSMGRDVQCGTKPSFVNVILWFFSFNLQLICTSEFLKKLKLHEPPRRVQFQLYEKNKQLQIHLKFNKKNRMITC